LELALHGTVRDVHVRGKLLDGEVLFFAKQFAQRETPLPHLALSLGFLLVRAHYTPPSFQPLEFGKMALPRN
jgi:hypothetical protein